MPAAVRDDYSAEGLWRPWPDWQGRHQSRRLLPLAAVRDGIDRRSAAKIGGMDCQMLRLGPSVQRLGSRWSHRQLDRRPQASPFGGATGSARADRRGGSGSRAGRRRAPAADRPQAGHRRAVRVDSLPRYVGKLLHKLGCKAASSGDGRIVQAFKNVWPTPFATYGPPRSQGVVAEIGG
jgi:hypothetical protein